MSTPQQRKSGRSRAFTADFTSCRLFFVGGVKQWSHTGRSEACLLRSEADLLRGFCEGPKNSVWVAHTPESFAALARAPSRRTSDRRLLVLESLQEITHHVLMTWFRYVVVARNGISILRASELLEVLAAPNRDELFIGGAYDTVGKVVILYRGSVEPMVVPVSWFHLARGTKSKPDVRKIAIVDYGQTIRFGGYEVAADAILYEFDEEYRKRAKKRANASDDSLGGSIRRLRLQNGLTQSDFDLPLKTIARIERGEVRRPQASTLRKVATRLKVPLEALGTY